MWNLGVLFAVLLFPAPDYMQQPKAAGQRVNVLAQSDSKSPASPDHNTESYDQLREKIEKEREKAVVAPPATRGMPVDPCFKNPNLPQCGLVK